MLEARPHRQTLADRAGAEADQRVAIRPGQQGAMVAPRDLRQAFISGDEWAIESIDADGLAGALFAGDPGHSGGIEEWAQMERVAPDVVSTYRSLADAARTWLNDGYPLPDGPARS